MAIDLDGPEPLWRQVTEDLATRIAAGEWERRLPSFRILADEYQVSHATIGDALRELRHRGLIVTTRGRGAFIARRPDDDRKQ
ncbi:hypothetical protein Arub01_29770 [Actinomadura rubrobrunea]|uniref:HTH gntR-type domain-containing protein n=1 Tax=Actinomadura rubrobrunea TaxID=115335 RepID=A0A9W6PXK0_9ACTN|nr:winged helix-turn-helix domain-containing protein [Actinomadura rubrobrunea]GLW64733.1 hypothetical protein Arub01_29770 [Actinomadura rubrobrunea]